MNENDINATNSGEPQNNNTSLRGRINKIGDSISNRKMLILIYVIIAIIGVFFIINTIKLFNMFF